MRFGALITEAGLDPGRLVASPAPGATGRDADPEVAGVVMDSRRLAPGEVFVCVPGAGHDGHDLAPEAVASGAAALVVEHPLPLDVPQLVVASSRRAVGPLADAFFGHPSRQLTVIGVTGTNGKTTTVSLLAAILGVHGWRTEAVGTLTQARTTPEAPELHARLAKWRDGGGRAVAMEVSSHALAQHRTDATRFAAGVLTNVTQDHLDYHHTMDAYFEAKARLFEPGVSDVAVVNRADPWGGRLIARLRAGGREPVTFASEDAVDLVLDPSGATFRWRGEKVRFHLGGRFNVDNALAAATTAAALGVPTTAIAEGLEATPRVPGRFEAVEAGQAFTVLVDYSHTPDGLDKAIRAARELTSGRVIVVFGAGGDRDAEKRPLMGERVGRLADLGIVTSDNPRSEDPWAIIDRIVAGFPPDARYQAEPDRAAAIAMAVSLAADGDVVLVAGKGHEQGQDIGGRILPFDDVEVSRQALVRMLRSREEGR